MSKKITLSLYRFWERAIKPLKTKLDGVAEGANAYTHPSYTARTGKPTSNQTPAFGGTATVSQITSDATGHVTGMTDRTIKIPDTAMTGATTSAAGTKGLVPAPAKGDANRYLRSDGTWQVPPNDNTTYSEATTSAAGLMSAADKTKLDGVAEGANAYTHPSYTARTGKPTSNQTPAFGGTATVSQVTSDATGHVTGMTDRTIKIPDTAMTGATTSAAGTKGLVPAPAKGDANRYLRSDGTWTVPPNDNTTYSEATTSAAGLMSAADKTKLDGVAEGANAYTHPTTSGNKHIPSGGSSGQILRWSADGTAAWGADNNTTYSEATTSAAGLMSAADKTKLDGVATGANKYTHPSYTARTGKPTANATPAFGGTATVSQVTSDATGHVTGMTDRTIKIPDTAMTGATTSAAGTKGLVPAPAAGDANRYLRSDGTWAVPPNDNTTYSEATTSAAGLMSAADKTKLDGVATGANKYTHPSYTAQTGKPTANATPAFGGTATVSQVTSDATGHVTGMTDRTIKIPDTAMTGATTSAAGTKGLVPAPAAGDANRYLRSDGTWTVPPNDNTTFSEATTSAAGLMSAADKTKLNGVATGANKYTHPTTSGNKHIPAGGSSGQILRWSADGTAAWGNDNNTTYSEATTSAAGLMSAADKTKLNGVAEGATANSASSTTPKANGTAAVGSETAYARGDHVHPSQTTVSGNAGTATTLKNARTIDGVSFNGSAAISHYGTCSTAAATVAKEVSCTGFTLVTGAWVAVRFTITNTGAVASLTLNVNNTGAKNIKYRNGNLPSAGALAAGRTYLFVYDGTYYQLIGDLDTNTTYSAATTSTNGLMSSTDKTKLDGIATGANAYTHPTSAGNKHIPSGGSSGQILRWSADGTAAWGNDNNTTYSAATPSAAGLMSAADKSTFNILAENRTNKLAPASLSLPTSGWTNDTSETSIYKYYYDLTVSVATADQIPHVDIDRGSMQAAIACGLCPSCETLSGKIRFRAVQAPASAIAGTYWLES